MTRSSKKTPKKSSVYTRDVIIFTARGEGFCYKKGKTEYRHIQDLIFQRDFGTLRNILRGFYPKPLFIMNSREGYILVDKTLCPRFCVLIVMIPSLSPKELFEALSACRRFVSFDALSEEERSCISTVECDELNEAQLEFIGEITETYTTILEFEERTVSPEGILSWASELAHKVCRVSGYGLECSLGVILEVDERNKTCLQSYYWLIISFLLIASRYSASKSVNLKLHFNQSGLYCDFSFKISSKYSQAEPIPTRSDVRRLGIFADIYKFMLYCEQKEDVFTVRAFPWTIVPDSSDIKRKRKTFIH